MSKRKGFLKLANEEFKAYGKFHALGLRYGAIYLHQLLRSYAGYINPGFSRLRDEMGLKDNHMLKIYRKDLKRYSLLDWEYDKKKQVTHYTIVSATEALAASMCSTPIGAEHIIEGIGVLNIEASMGTAHRGYMGTAHRGIKKIEKIDEDEEDHHHQEFGKGIFRKGIVGWTLTETKKAVEALDHLFTSGFAEERYTAFVADKVREAYPGEKAGYFLQAILHDEFLDDWQIKVEMEKSANEPRVRVISFIDKDDPSKAHEECENCRAVVSGWDGEQFIEDQSSCPSCKMRLDWDNLVFAEDWSREDQARAAQRIQRTLKETELREIKSDDENDQEAEKTGKAEGN